MNIIRYGNKKVYGCEGSKFAFYGMPSLAKKKQQNLYKIYKKQNGHSKAAFVAFIKNGRRNIV